MILCYGSSSRFSTPRFWFLSGRTLSLSGNWMLTWPLRSLQTKLQPLSLSFACAQRCRVYTRFDLLLRCADVCSSENWPTSRRLCYQYTIVWCKFYMFLVITWRESIPSESLFNHNNRPLIFLYNLERRLSATTLYVADVLTECPVRDIFWILSSNMTSHSFGACKYFHVYCCALYY